MRLKTFFTILLFSSFFSLLHAQGGPGGPGDPGGDPGGDANVPIDGGLSLLIAAGVGYAAKKKYDKRKKEAAGDETKEPADNA